MNDKWKSVIISGIVLVVFIILNIFIFTTDSIVFLGSVIVYVDLFPIMFFTFSFLNRYKKFEYDNHTIEIYAGFINHYIKIDNETKDEYKGLSYTAINLKCKINDKNIEVVISLTNHVKIKINDELVK